MPVKTKTAIIESVIISLHGQGVIIANAVAALYGLEVKRRNEQVKRNADLFGEKHDFGLTGD